MTDFVQDYAGHSKKSDAPATAARMPVLFVGHGSPMNAIEDNAFSRTWRELGRKFTGESLASAPTPTSADPAHAAPADPAHAAPASTASASAAPAAPASAASAAPSAACHRHNKSVSF